MANVLDLLRTMTDTAGIDRVGTAHGLSAQMTEAAVGALLPVMAAALGTQGTSPDAARRFLALVGGENAANAFDAVTAAIPPEARAQVEAALAEAMRSPRVQKAIAAQAAAQAGVAEAVMQEMIPAVASATMSSLAAAPARMLAALTGAAPPADTPAAGAFFDAAMAAGRDLGAAQLALLRAFTGETTEPTPPKPVPPPA